MIRCHSAAPAHLARLAAICLLALVAACDVSINRDRKEDTSVAAARAPGGATSGAGAGGVPAVPTDSSAGAADSGIVEMWPPRVSRGGVLFAWARGVATQSPRCTWKSAPLPCYRLGDGVLATVPLPADEAPGTFTLAIERPQGRLTRTVVVNDRDFGRELVFLDSATYALTQQTSSIARDARAVRGVVSGESAERRWTGRWAEPVPGAKSAGYGVERFYHRASDSARAISLGSTATTRGTFGGDTTTATPARGSVPAWRHAGVDVPARRGANVAAPAAGVVADVGDYTLMGRTLVLDHGQGVFSAYFHLDTVLVRKGDVVRGGRTVARVGRSGLATGPHLHYGLYLHGRDIDPAAWRDMPAWARGDSAALAAPPRATAGTGTGTGTGTAGGR